jgi:CubicO group peptidase (beta-lactamase class C family)
MIKWRPTDTAVQMYMAVAYLLSTLTGKPYPEFVRERIFDPLGIPESGATFSPAEAEKTGNMSQAWYAQDNSTVLRIPFWFDEEAAKLGSGPGGVFISAQGLVRSSMVHERLL